MVLALCPTEFDCHVSAIDVAGFAQPLLESGDEMRESGGGPAVEKPNHRHLRLLRPRRGRPGSRGAQTADEISTSEQTAQHVFSTLPVSIIKHCITTADVRPWIILKCSESFGSAKALR